MDSPQRVEDEERSGALIPGRMPPPPRRSRPTYRPPGKMMHTSLWRQCVANQTFPPKPVFVRTRPPPKHVWRGSSLRSELLPEDLPQPPPEPRESVHKKPAHHAYFSRKLAYRKRNISINNGPRIDRWTKKLRWDLRIPNYKNGHRHLLKNGYVGFIYKTYMSSKGFAKKWDVEKAWVGLVRGKFEEWRTGKRIKDWKLKALGKSLLQVDDSRSRECFRWWENRRKRDAFRTMEARLDFDSIEV